MVALNDERYVYESLTRFNYFPNQKNAVVEMPPIFTTTTFTPEIAERIIASSPNRSGGWDQVSYAITRHNNVPRTLSLMHPVSCAYLAKTIYNNWSHLKSVMNNEQSVIKPAIHTDGRIMIMNYEDADEKAARSLEDSFGKMFRVETDISGCFNSIYTHSIPWAVIGFEAAKAKVKARPKQPEGWYDRLDMHQRWVKRNETQGIAIGPASSSIIVELILGCVDKVLVSRNFNYRRYIDDYIGFCATYEEAQEFIRVLAAELERFKLNLNLQKTVITALPCPVSDHWVSKLSAAAPNTIIDALNTRRKLQSSEIVQYLDYAVRLNKETPDGSVLKYAVSSIMHSIDKDGSNTVFLYVLGLSWHYPVLIPHLKPILELCGLDAADYERQFNLLIGENSRNRRSDAVTWAMYFLLKYNLTLSSEFTQVVIDSKDCAALVCLNLLRPDEPLLQDFVNGLLGGTEYDRDQYWLLLYEFYRMGKIDNPYDDQAFPIMKKYQVQFTTRSEGPTRAEQYCDYLANPFADEHFVFDSFEKFTDT